MCLPLPQRQRAASLDPSRKLHVPTASGAPLLAVDLQVLAGAAPGTDQESILADVGGKVELVGDVAAHEPRFTLDPVERYAELVEEVRVGLGDGLVGLLPGAPVGVEGVKVLHEKLAASEESPLRMLLVAKFV